MADDKVKITGKIELEVEVLVEQEVYEKWDAGDRGAGDHMASLLSDAAHERLREADGADMQLVKATLVEDDGYLGTDITVLKRW